MASSDRRIAASRINALKSTGPLTDEGKEVSRANASKLGMTAVVVVPGEEAGEADRRTERLQGQLAPGGDEMGLILARHAALLSIQVERRARNMAALAEHRVRTAEADHADARRAEAEGLFTSIGAHGPSNHRRLLSLPEGVDLLLDQIEELRNHLRVGSAWTGAHADAFDHLTGRRYSMPLTRMAALTILIQRDDAPAEAPADDLGGGPGPPPRLPSCCMPS